MYRFRIEYSKEGPVAYVSHLDLNRMFERAARRAGCPWRFRRAFIPIIVFFWFSAPGWYGRRTGIFRCGAGGAAGKTI